MDGFWAFFWLAVVMKIPVLLALWLVWYAIKAAPAPEQEPPDGGGSDRHPRPHPRPHLPRPPRRGPHVEPAPRSPSRMRATGKRISHAGDL